MSVIVERESKNLLADYIELFTGNLQTEINLPSSLDRQTHVGIRQQARITVISGQSQPIQSQLKTVEYGSGSINGWSYG